MRFEDFCKEKFIPFCIDENLSPATISGYNQSLKQVMKDSCSFSLIFFRILGK